MGKNKRKHDAPTPLAADVTKKNLNKIRKMSKIENPVVTEIKNKATEFLADRKNSNSIIDIIGHLDLFEKSAVVNASITAIKRIVLALVTKNQIKRPSEPKDDESTEMKYRRWLFERVEDALKKIAELMFHRKREVSQLAVATLMSILQAQNFSVEKPRAWDEEGQKILNLIVTSLFSSKHDAKVPMGRFGEYYDYGDVCFNLLSVLSKLLAKAGKKEKGSPVYVDNVLNFLESFPLPDQAKLNSSPKFLSNKEVKLDFGEVRKNYGGIWTSVVLCKFSKEQYKRSLIMLNEKVIPQLAQPVFLTDFLLGCFDIGGAISILALSGVFTLMTKYNLDYPDFYTKLYSLFQVEIFFVKYKARFLHLSDMFLASTHLPQVLVASFVKRIARISLQAPAECLPTCIRFIHNLISRHRGLRFLMDDSDRSDLTSDPYLVSEPDPYKTNAMKSSLWELQTLTNHILPEVSIAAKELINKGIKDTDKDVSAVLEKTMEDYMTSEVKRNISEKVPLNWEEPVGLKFAKDDLLSEIFDFS